MQLAEVGREQQSLNGGSQEVVRQEPRFEEELDVCSAGQAWPAFV